MGPNQARWPMPQILLFAICGVLGKQKQSDLIILLCLVFSAYLRPREALGLRSEDVVKPIDKVGTGFPVWSLVLAPVGREERTKTALSDKAVVLDNGEMGWLGPGLGILAQQR